MAYSEHANPHIFKRPSGLVGNIPAPMLVRLVTQGACQRARAPVALR